MYLTLQNEICCLGLDRSVTLYNCCKNGHTIESGHTVSQLITKTIYSMSKMLGSIVVVIQRLTVVWILFRQCMNAANEMYL